MSGFASDLEPGRPRLGVLSPPMGNAYVKPRVVKCAEAEVDPMNTDLLASLGCVRPLAPSAVSFSLSSRDG